MMVDKDLCLIMIIMEVNPVIVMPGDMAGVVAEAVDTPRIRITTMIESTMIENTMIGNTMIGTG